MTLASTVAPLQKVYGTLLLDLDGVVYRGPHAVPYAVDVLSSSRDQGNRLAFVTNNAARTADAVAEHLTSLGLAADAGDVVTSSHAVAAMLRQSVTDGTLPRAANVLVIGQDGLRRPLADAGFTIVESAEDNPAVVVQGFGSDTGWRDLAEATYAISAGARWIASNLDLTLPTERGLAPGNGSLVAAVSAALGGAMPTAAGKPERTLFDTALAALGATAEDTIVIGDRLDSDIEGAVAADLPGLLVLTGVSTVIDLFTAPEHRRPSFVAFDLRALAEPQTSVEHVETAGVISCGGWTVGTDTADLHLSGSGSPTDALRAGTQAAWSFPNSGYAELAGAIDRLRP